MAFHVIHIAPDLSDLDRARATTAGPPWVATSAEYPRLLDLAGFGENAEVDLTDQYRATAAAWLDESARAAGQLEEIFGVDEHRRMQQERQETLTAIESGVLKRSLFVAQTG